MTTVAMLSAEGLVQRSQSVRLPSALGVRAWLGLLLALHAAAACTATLLGYLAPAGAQAAASSQDVTWAVLVLVAAVAGLWSCGLARRAARCQQHDMTATALVMALTVVTPALAVSVIALMAVARHPAALTAPIVATVSPIDTADLDSTTPESPAAIDFKPDAQRGLKLYANSCAACHGESGEGVENIGPALAATTFLTERSDEQMTAFLQVGRIPGDADSKMGRAMPARGGNPALTDHDLADIVAHLRTLLAAEGGTDEGIKAATPPRWLAPAPVEPVAGVADVYRVPTWQDIEGVERPAYQPWHLELVLRCFTVMGLAQALLLLTIAALLLRALAGAGSAADDLGHAAAAWSLLAVMAALAAVALLPGGLA